MKEHSLKSCESTIGKCGICAAYLNKMNIKQTWFSINSAPKNGTRILIAFKKPGTKPNVHEVCWNSFLNQWLKGTDRDEILSESLGVPVLWTHLPTPPDIEELV
jgi:hypothetical protein